MKRSIIYLGIAIALFLSLATGALAAPDLESYVPAGYDLTIRLGFHKALADPALEPVRSLVIPPGADNSFDALTSLTGVSLRTDVETIVLAGHFDKARKADGLVLARGRFNKDKLVAFLRKNEKYETAQVGNLTAHGFWSKKDGEMKYAAFLADDVIAAGRRAVIETVISARRKGAKRLTDNPVYASHLAAVPQGALIGVVGVIPEQMGGDPHAQALMKSIKAVRLCVTVEQGIHATASFTMADEQVAKLGGQAIQGILAFVQLADPKSPLVGACRGAKLSVQGVEVSASADLTIQAFAELVVQGRKAPMLK
jgi:hypothetical protein